MNVSGIEGMLSQMRAAMAVAQGSAAQNAKSVSPANDFSNVLKTSLDSVSQAHEQTESLQKAFVMGDDKVSLSDVMISMQKSNVAFQTTVQVRNKFVAAYNDIMNMQV